MRKNNFLYPFIIGVTLTVVLALIGSVVFYKSAKPKTSIPVTTGISSAPASLKVEAPAEKLAKPAALPIPVATVKESKAQFQKGMTFIAWTEDGYSNANAVLAMEQLVALGVEWACVIPTQYQQRYNSPQIFPVKGKSASDESLASAIRKLHNLKIKIMLKPHLDLVESAGKWRGDIGFSDPDEWQKWFESYTAFILHYATIAAQENVEIFCIGTELSNAALTQPQFWLDLIKKAREVYKGQLTYAANWNDEFSQIKFWNELDYAGVDPYFPLVTGSRPSVEQLKEVWTDWLKIINAWQKTINKPVLLTEIGYKSTLDAIDEPWQYTAMGELDLQMQVKCYQALLESFWDKPWFYGIYWWYWGAHPNMGGESNRGFTPQNKPAQEVIKEWYSKPVSEKAY
jgi:hypothetical protein